MATFDPPTPFHEGGEPQSLIAPGDSQRELIHEVRNLSAAVGLLNKTYVRKEDFERRAKIVYVVAGCAILIVVLALASLFYTDHEHQAQQTALVNKLVGNCQSRNSSATSTTNFINGLLGIVTQEDRASISQPTSFQLEIEHEYVILLTNYEKSQPKQVSCQSIRP